METQQILPFETISWVDRKAGRRPSKLIFNQLIEETVDQVFSSWGPVCRQGIYSYLDERYGLKKNDIADHMIEFSEALEQIFGCAAALLEIEIMKRLCRKVPQFKHRPGERLTFPDYVNALSRFVY